MGEASDKGRLLEEGIEAFFRQHGYETRRNLILEGRSGGRHEIDVYAEKSDGITTFKIAVECKAWEKPIEKDVVSKISYVVSDLGLNKAVVVSLQGYRLGAKQAADELGIDVWGPDEIQQRLGAASLARLNVGRSSKPATGFHRGVSEDYGRRMIETRSRGVLGFGREEVAWFGIVWIPCFLMHFATSTRQGRIKKTIQTTRSWNLYEAITGMFLMRLSAPSVSEVDLGLGHLLPRRMKPTKIATEIRKSMERFNSVVTQSAQLRHARALADLGIPHDIEGLEIDRIDEVFLPIYAGLLQKGVQERLVAVDAHWGEYREDLSSVLTSSLAFFRDSFT